MYELYGGMIDTDICLTIDDKRVICPRGSSILAAARGAGIEIPTLCYLKGLTPTGSCGVCAVELEENGETVIRRACRYEARDGMVVRTNTPAVRAYRRERITELLSKHPNDCLTCQKTGGDCRLQEVTHLFEINPEVRKVPGRGMDTSSPAMIRNMDKCIACGRCVTVCSEVQKIGIYEMYTDPETGDRYARTKKNVSLSATSCINCGQCVKVCPVAALTEKSAMQRVMDALNDPKKTVVWQMAPAVQNTLGEGFGLQPGTDVTGKIAAAMKQLGGYAYNTDFSADVTIMEEGAELIQRIRSGGVLPMMTSCCPGWVKYMEYNYPDQLSHLSSCKSPQQIFGALAKIYLPDKIGVNAEDIFHVSIMPCVAKKYEMQRPEMKNALGIQDVDAVLTSREAIRLMRLKGIDLAKLESKPFDSFMGQWTGAGRIFGTTGGVMEAALRTVTVLLTDGELDRIDYEEARGYRGVKEATVKIGDMDLKIAVVNGIGNVGPIMEDIRAGKSPYHFIEVMACPGGCLNGGGAPLASVDQVAVRMAGMYRSDQNAPIRRSHENPDVKKLYEEFLEEPDSPAAHFLLHTHYTDRSGEVQ